MNWNPRRIFAAALLGLLWLAAGPVRAADTDVFANPNSGYNAPNVLFVIDTGASFSASNAVFRCGIDAAGNVYTTNDTVVTRGTGRNSTALDGTNGGVEQCALYSVIKSIATGTTATVNVGVMLFNSNQKAIDPAASSAASMFLSPTPCVNGRGGCLAVPLTPLTATSAGRILDWVKGWEISGASDYLIKSPANRGDGASMQEAWAYFTGHTGISGRNYTAPASPCGNNYVVFIGNAYDTQASPKDTTNEVSSPLKALNGSAVATLTRADPAATTDQIAKIIDTRSFKCGPLQTDKIGTLSGDEGSGGYAVNWARYMFAQGIKTYTVGITGPGCDSTYVAQLDKMGSSEIGGGKYFNTTNFDELVKALKTLLGEIQSVNSVFAAVSLPVSVNQQGSYLNQVFVGMFRPQTNFLPQWTGNLKQYKLGMVGNVLRLLDAGDAGAINSLTGFITECARSFWTSPNSDDYWSLQPMGGCIGIGDSKVSNSPDGNIVEKGAQAYMLRSGDPANRKILTCDPAFASCSAFTRFHTSNDAITPALMGTGSGGERDTLINFLRGANVDNQLSKGTTAFRPPAHGDIVHSRPVPVNHGTNDAPNIVVYYGGNDFTLRAVNGNRTTTYTVSQTVTFTAGSELWSFVAPEFFGKVKRLRDNVTPISFPTSNVAEARDKDYGMDGPISAFQGTIDNAAKTYVYATMRRGGRVIYAFDVTTPHDPRILWKKGCPAAGDCSADYGNIGQTWSTMKAMYSYGWGSGSTPLMITGGGYDSCEDYDAKTSGGVNHQCTNETTKGNRVFVIDAASGTIAKAFETDRAVIADVTLVRDTNDKVLYGYTADLGGNVYRITFGTAEGADRTANWSITKIASLGCATPCSNPTRNRKFMFAPSVATPDTIGSSGATYFVSIGSGDREKPVKEYLATTSIQNYFFMIKDRPGDNTWLSAESTNCGGASVICLNSLVNITSRTAPTQEQLNEKPKGWALRLDSTEQVVTSAVTIFGVVTFSTHQPAQSNRDNACRTDLGTTRVYNISYLNAAGITTASERWERVSGDGLPPSPVAGQVTLDDGRQVPFCIGCSKDSPLEGAPPLTLSTVTQPKGRLYWYKER